MTVLAAQTLYDWLLFLHVLAATIWLGGGVMLAFTAARHVGDLDPDAVRRFTATMRATAPFVLAPATVAVLVLGIGLVVDTDAWDFGQLWVQLGLGLFVAAFLVGAAGQSRTAIAATRAAEQGDDGEARRQLRRWLAGYALIVLLLIVAVWDMTTKPGL
jgi:uncharacterized membrane protein